MPLTQEQAAAAIARVAVEADRTKLSVISRTTPPTQPLIRQAAVNRWQRTSMAGLTPERLATILRRVERGDTEDWVDLCSYMLRVDGHLRSVYDTRRIAVAGARWAVEPGYAKTPDEEALAQDAADLCAENLDRLPRLEAMLEHLLHGEGVGWSGLEHSWTRIHGVWLSYPHAVHARDIEPAEDWTWKFRTYEDGRLERWVLQRDENPARFLVHVPGGIGEIPTLAGDLHAVAWMFVFKHWALLFRQTGLERNANAFLFGITPPSSAPEARDALFDGLQRLSADQVAAFEALPNGQVPVQLLESTRTAADNWNPAIESMNAEMSKALLGSTINVEVLHAGGNRALGESQFSTTILPRMHRSARALESTLEMQWFRWILGFNSHLFGGRMPPTPRLRLKLVADDKPVITDLHVGAGAVDANELRESAGLPAWEGERGTRIAQPVAKQFLPADHRQPVSPAQPQTVSSGKQGQLVLPHTARESGTRSSGPRIELADDEGPRVGRRRKQGRKVDPKKLPDHYVWYSESDGQVRSLHRALHGKVFRWDDPPVSGVRGERQHPGESLGCRCRGVPVSDDYAKRRRELQERDRQREVRDALKESDIPVDVLDSDDFSPTSHDDFKGHYKDFWFKSEKQGGIPEDAAAAALDYQGFSYRRINDHLRGRRKTPEDLLPEVEEQVAGLDKAMDKAPRVPEHLMVFRGLDTSHLPDDALEVGGEIVDDAFVSTSLSSRVTARFLGKTLRGKQVKKPVLFQIEVPKGSRALYMGAARSTDPGDESELLLPRGSRFEIIASDGSTDPISGARIVRLRLVTD